MIEDEFGALRTEVRSVLVIARQFGRERQRAMNLPPNEQTGPPSDDVEVHKEQERRLGLIERTLDNITRRVDALERIVRKYDIAPMRPPGQRRE